MNSTRLLTRRKVWQNIWTHGNWRHSSTSSTRSHFGRTEIYGIIRCGYIAVTFFIHDISHLYWGHGRMMKRCNGTRQGAIHFAAKAVQCVLKSSYLGHCLHRESLIHRSFESVEMLHFIPQPPYFDVGPRVDLCGFAKFGLYLHVVLLHEKARSSPYQPLSPARHLHASL